MADAVASAEAAWGTPLPDWVLALAEECDARESQAAVGRALGYSGATVNQVLHRKYAGDLARFEATVRGRLLAETVDCPVVGELRRDRCIAEQRTPLHSADPLRVKLFRACRGGCPHSRLKKGGRS